MINMLRRLPQFMNASEVPTHPSSLQTVGLKGKEVCILGAGNIGTNVGNICKVMGMRVRYFHRGENLLHSVTNADVVVNVLGQNSSTKGLLDLSFFKGMKPGSYFISITSPTILDTAALLTCLGDTIAAAAVDAGGIQAGDTSDAYYKMLLQNDKMIVTPHIAYATDVTARIANDMMIENIEAFVSGKPRNLLH
ncbi:MAG: NAD(P)-dependent oxidoreductase [Patescibacteria group bacterium]